MPAAVSLWRGRSLARLIDDPALPERLLAGHRASGFVLAFSLVVLIFNWPHYLVWTLPLLFVARLVAVYPFRKILYRETWSLAAYLSFFVRLVIAIFGFWILLAMTPALVSMSDRHEWMVASGLTAILLIWNARYADLVRYLLRARAVDDPVLVLRFKGIVDACGLSTPHLEQVNLRGGVFANAVALASLRGSAVVLSETLVARLDHDEVIAICAHEVAHLEHYNPRRLRRINLGNYILMVTGGLFTSVVRLTFPSALWILTLLWVCGLLVTLMVRARDRQKNETASDLRAVSLTQDPESLIRALAKLHAISWIPRRWETEFERQATHPSLARRIQAIRASSGMVPQSLGSAVGFAATDGSLSVTFHEDRVLWDEGESASHSLSYGHLTELRLEARRSGAPRLLAVDRTGRRWEIPLGDVDVARAQGVLDIVDARLAPPAPPLSVSPAVARWFAILVILCSWPVMYVAPVIAAAFAILRPAPPLVGAAGAAAVVAAGLTWRDHGLSGTQDSYLWLAGSLLICGSHAARNCYREPGEAAFRNCFETRWGTWHLRDSCVERRLADWCRCAQSLQRCTRLASRDDPAAVARDGDRILAHQASLLQFDCHRSRRFHRGLRGVHNLCRWFWA